MVNIKVAVRIRPLTQRELLSGEEIIVRKEDKSVLVTNPKIPERQDGDSRQRTRRFTVDFCYDSGDLEGGTQELVYEEIGSEVLRSMCEGYNACVLAYGPSASGKTYTIMGLQNDPGLTPRICEGLFEKLIKNCLESKIRTEISVSLQDDRFRYSEMSRSPSLSSSKKYHAYSKVSFHLRNCRIIDPFERPRMWQRKSRSPFLEIYNEKVRDLLGGEETGGSCGNFSLRVREHPKLGPYVQGLSEHFVSNKRELLEFLTTGNKRRSTAATENNVHSSRSHAVFTIRFKRSVGGNFETEKTSKVHLVDLAGSERARASQSKARLQEGANINKSLVTLGNVISALAESLEAGIASDSKSWHPFVPYRDSVLTWLLKDTLGGNSNTIMIATISPASSCLSETVNTLRYAKRTKKIVNRPIVNEDPKIRTIRELRKEIARLRGLLLLFHSCGGEAESMEFGIKDRGEASPESKWPAPEGKHVTSEEEACDKEENREIWKGEEGREGEKRTEGEKESEDERKEVGFWEPAPPRKGERAPGVSGAREICDEKESYVNGSVNDNFSHEAQIFSDSLESFSSGYLKSENCCEAGGDAPSEEERRNPIVRGEERSREKFSPDMLHRSRPDLIKGISTRSKDSFPPGSGQSSTDVSNLSQSTSENSLNSSGSADALPSKRRSIPHAGDRGDDPPEYKTRKGKKREETLEIVSKKKEKRSEAVEAVTSRLYGAKKQDFKTKGKKKEDEEDGDDGNDVGLEHLKLCKRARMKLFDLRRKLALAKKMKKTVDNDTQTDQTSGTVRVKEKCVTTEANGGIEKRPDKDKKKKPYMIMNQVFIPKVSNYVVECGRVVRIEAPETMDTRESATQTSLENERYKNANTSPIKFSPREEDFFSEDSLDLESKSRSRGRRFPERDEEAGNEKSRGLGRFKNFNLSDGFERDFGDEEENGDFGTFEDSGGALFNGLPFAVFTEKGIGGRECKTWDLRKEENESSENSCASTEGGDMNSLSETSSEDFVFYESLKGKDALNAVKVESDRELYTITENSEQSDPGDGFGPVQNKDLREKLSNEKKEDQERGDDSFGGSHTNGSKEKLETLGKSKVSPHSVKSSEGKIHLKESEDFDEVLHGTKRSFKSRRTTPPEGPNLPKHVATRVVTDRLVSRVAAHSVGKNEIERAEDTRHREEARMKSQSKERIDFQMSAQKQYLNLNISNGSNGESNGGTPFSVDTHLFEKPSRKDQSTEAMSTSADSITFVFMGPAKTKTSVLMEIIKRSLGRGSAFFESPPGERRSRSRGVQCDANLLRSVSMDTAMIALSRLARNQEPSPEMPRTTSLGTLSSCETSEFTEGGKLQELWERSCQCEIGSEFFEGKFTTKHSVATNAVSDAVPKCRKTEAEKRKKTVSWLGEAQGSAGEGDGGEGFASSNFGSKHRSFHVVDAEEWNPEESPSTRTESDGFERRVRFVKAKGEDLEKEQRVFQNRETAESSANLKAFLKEMTQLLKNINSRSQRHLEYSEDKITEWDADEHRRRSALKTAKRSDAMTSSRTENCPEKGGFLWRPRMASEAVAESGKRTDGNRMNLTWPRRRQATGKPPTGTKPKLPRSPFPSRFESSHFPGFPNFASSSKIWSQSSRTGSSGHSWNLSDLSVALSNTLLAEAPVSWFKAREADRLGTFCSPPAARPDVQKVNFRALSEMETDLEECCRRLETAARKDETRESISERKKNEFEKEEEHWTCSEDTGSELWFENEKSKMALKRRKTERCAGGCTCGKSRAEPCRRLWSKGCRSSFELDSFGPGSAHCHQFCMFCRKKEAEIYHSALCLNSECSSGLCRLNHYGFCPCSPVKLNQVTPSPRAYMQHLLALRKRIVGQVEDPHRRAWESRQESSRGFSARDRMGPTQKNFY